MELAKRMFARDPATAPTVGDRVPYVIIKVTCFPFFLGSCLQLLKLTGTPLLPLECGVERISDTGLSYCCAMAIP